MRRSTTVTLLQRWNKTTPGPEYCTAFAPSLVRQRLRSY